MDLTALLFLFLLFIVAVLYSSVGHGGASGYLALMGLFHFAPEMMRPSALLLNVFVSLIAWWQYSRNEKLNVKLFIWLIAGSIPAAFLGALITIDVLIYKKILGAILLFQAIRLIGFLKVQPVKLNEPSLVIAVLCGSVIGFISGIIGIGGGIILSPLLLLFGWTTMKQTALISALFIFLNSLSGIAGLLSKGTVFESVLYLWIAIAFAGGLLGAWLGSTRFSSHLLKRVLGVVLLVAGIKLMFI